MLSSRSVSDVTYDLGKNIKLIGIISNMDVDDFKKMARAFGTVEVGPRDDTCPEHHVVCLTYPPDSSSVSKIKYLRRYKSFIHEARIVCSDADSSAKDLYDSLIPRGCVVQFFHVEYSVETLVSTVNVRALAPVVSSLHIKIASIQEDDVFRCVSTVLESDDLGIRLSGWHKFDEKNVQLVVEALGKSNPKSNFFSEVENTHLVFWSEESYV